MFEFRTITILNADLLASEVLRFAKLFGIFCKLLILKNCESLPGENASNLLNGDVGGGQWLAKSFEKLNDMLWFDLGGQIAQKKAPFLILGVYLLGKSERKEEMILDELKKKIYEVTYG